MFSSAKHFKNLNGPEPLSSPPLPDSLPLILMLPWQLLSGKAYPTMLPLKRLSSADIILLGELQAALSAALLEPVPGLEQPAPCRLNHTPLVFPSAMIQDRSFAKGQLSFNKKQLPTRRLASSKRAALAGCSTRRAGGTIPTDTTESRVVVELGSVPQ